MVEANNMDNQKIIDMSHKITDKLQHEASMKLQREMAYHDGYIQACEDFGRRLRQSIYEENNE